MACGKELVSSVKFGGALFLLRVGAAEQHDGGAVTRQQRVECTATDAAVLCDCASMQER